jgi:hypothetical protein
MRKLEPAHIALWSLSIAWTTAMISLWDWNVEGTGTWFAALMIIAGVALFSVTLAHYMRWGVWVGDFLRRILYRKNKDDAQ